MTINFEAGRQIDAERKNITKAISSFIEENGFWMFEVDGEESEIRFQVWTDQNGNPMLLNDELKNLISRLKTETDALPENSTVSFNQMAGGGAHVSIKLDKGLN